MAAIRPQQGIPAALIDAKGDVIAGSAADTAVRVAVGTSGQVLTADSTVTAGVKWATPAAVSSSFLPGTKEWYVNPALSVSGTGHSPGAGFKTFAEAHSAATTWDTIYICGNLTEQLHITKSVKIMGLGNTPTIFAPSSLTAFTDIAVHVDQSFIQMENLQLRGHATFKGSMLLVYGALCSFKRIWVNGTNEAATATAYPTGEAAGTGIGGCGIVTHFSESNYWEDIVVGNCSIGIAAGTSSSNHSWLRITGVQNAQHFVMGLTTAVDFIDPTLLTAPWDYGGGSEGVGFWTMTQFKTGAGLGIVGAPSMDLLTTSGRCTFINFDMDESGGPFPAIRIQSDDNKFINAAGSLQCAWYIEGNYNMFVGGYIQQPWAVYGHDNIFEGLNSNIGGILYGPGYHNTFRRCNFGATNAGSPMNITGADNFYDDCRWTQYAGGAYPVFANLGPNPRFARVGGVLPLTYSSSMTPDLYRADLFTAAATNGTAFTFANPIDTSNGVSTNIMRNTPWRLRVTNSSGGAHGTASVGAKYLLVGGGTTLWAGGTIANGKSRTVEFYYDSAADKHVELSRSTADIG